MEKQRLPKHVTQAPACKEPQFDYLRVIAAVAVVLIHVCAMDWRRIDVYGSRWVMIHIYDMICKFSVPVFFMISGRFLLDPLREMGAEKLKDKIIRLAVAFLSWSLVYTLVNILRVIQNGHNLKENLSWIIIEFFGGEYHMWFLFAIGMLYLITPILRLIVQNQKITEYFLILFFCFGILLDTLCVLPKVGVIFTTIAEKMVFHFALGYSGYFVLGYYLYRYPLSATKCCICYWAGVVGTIFSVIATMVVSFKQGIANEELADYLTPNVAASSIAIYLFFIKRYSVKTPGKVIELISKHSFGIYLAHPLILWLFEMIGLTPAVLAPVIMVPVISALALGLSLLISMLFQHIPYLGKIIT